MKLDGAWFILMKVIYFYRIARFKIQGGVKMTVTEEFSLYRIVSAIILSGSNILLVQNNSNDADYTWSLPGGVVELNETLEKALYREVHEETGLHVQNQELAYIHESFIRKYTAHSLVTVFRIEVDLKDTPQMNDPDGEIVQVKWVPVRELSHYIKKSHVLRALEKWLKTRQTCYIKEKEIL
ncbi:NUDIX hydrolase [Gracilibacillus timonensis]|uniref:NUDIX hydrolase n=2 Tax=Gracilibacillus TaxID=74385 RepID=UPI0013731634|nr:NUDIX hydrolase [Gracilibacillus timonensis]